VRPLPWDYPLAGAHIAATPRYRLHTNLPPAQAAAAARLLDGAFAQYREVAGDVPVSPAPLNGYLFATRAEWASFTQANTGPDARIYLQVNRGAYTVNDWFAAYSIGDATAGVLCHEGWHQFVARNFVGRLPPALEEGMACLFEAVYWHNGLPRWRLSSNPLRLKALEVAHERRRLLPLAEFLRLHAGELVGKKSDEVQAFYAQAWALARFLREDPRYAAGFERLLADTAAGQAWLPPHLARPHPRAWNAAVAEPTLEHYLATRIMQLDREFGQYVKRLVDEAE
jgi:hypothetical protein